MTTAYDRLTARFERISILQETRSMLGWDASTMMPPGGAASRGDQLAVLDGLAHAQLVAPEVNDDLAAAEASPPPSAWDRANLELMRQAHTRATALPARLVEEHARASSACEKVWREARKKSDFSMVRPLLAEVVRLTREQAQALGPALGLAPYDALMDSHQRGIGVADVTPIFAAYEKFLAKALPEVLERQAREPAPVLPAAPFAVATQEALCRRIAERLGFDFTRGRMDASTHPFSGGTPSDVRITTRYDEKDFTKSVLAIIHETGHALYDQGLPSERSRQPVGNHAGMAVHESQSLIVEMQAGRSDAYLRWLGPVLHATFGGAPQAYESNNLARLWRRVERSFIRVDADEMTYPAHVILRFRLEQALIEGSLQVADIPSAWNEGMSTVLGITPPDDAHGCLQDIHWYDGAFGYFPSYTLGAIAAAQLMAAARKAQPDLDAALSDGDITPLRTWLRANVHGAGSRHGFNALMIEATGQPLSFSAFEAHLTARYVGR